jgi:hypothetical protein
MTLSPQLEKTKASAAPMAVASALPTHPDSLLTSVELARTQLLTMSGSYAKQFMTTCGKAGKPPNPENYLAGFHTWRVHPGGEQFINDAEERAAIALEQEAGEAALSVSPITPEPSFLPEEKPLTPMMNHPKGRVGIRKRQNFNLR